MAKTTKSTGKVKAVKQTPPATNLNGANEQTPGAQTPPAQQTPPVATPPAITPTPGEPGKSNETKSRKDFIDESVAAKMKSYVKYYPEEKVFYISTDGQVFLNANKREAEAHQQFVDAKKELVEYKP